MSSHTFAELCHEIMSQLSQPYPLPKETAIAQHSSSWLSVAKQQVESLKFGTVTITVHEGRVVQVETSSKIRLDRTS